MRVIPLPSAPVSLRDGLKRIKCKVGWHSWGKRAKPWIRTDGSFVTAKRCSGCMKIKGDLKSRIEEQKRNLSRVIRKNRGV